MITLVSVSILAVFSMLSGLFNLNGKTLSWIVVIGLLGSLGFSVADWNSATPLYYNNMVDFDNYAVAFSSLIIGASVFIFLLSEHFIEGVKSYIQEHFALFLFAIAGMIVMVSYSNLTMLFVGIEILSVSLFILAGSQKKDQFSNEASLKYFLMGAFSTGIFLMGIALIYGVTGHFDIVEIANYLNNTSEAPDKLALIGMFMMLIGLSFKVSAAPFHFWTPDVYEGSPSFITMFMSSVVKVAGFAAFFRLFSKCFIELGDIWMYTVWVMAAITMTIGSISAIGQTSFKRILAYSSVSHAGYMLIALLLMKSIGPNVIFYYSVAYVISTLAVFGVILAVQSKTNSNEVSSLNGLVKHNTFLAVILGIGIVSMAGLPITAGFIAKFLVLKSALESGFLWLSLIAIINAIIGIYYYFQVFNAVFLKDAETDRIYEISFIYKVVLIIVVALIIVLALAPDFVYQLIK